MNILSRILGGARWLVAAIEAGLLWVSTVAVENRRRHRGLVLRALEEAPPKAVPLGQVRAPEGPFGGPPRASRS